MQPKAAEDDGILQPAAQAKGDPTQTSGFNNNETTVRGHRQDEGKQALIH